MALSTFDEQRVIFANSYWTDTDGTGAQGIGSSDDFQGRIDHIWATNEDTIDHVIDVGLTNGGDTRYVGSCTVPAGQGYAGTPAFDVLHAVLPATADAILLPPQSYISVRPSVALNTGLFLTVFIVGGYF